jgi:hypothetical protein
MNEIVQDTLVGVAVLGALGYLMRRRFKAKPGAACEGCPASPVAGARPAPVPKPLHALISIEDPAPRARASAAPREPSAS